MEQDIIIMLRERRIELGLTLKDIAKSVGVSEGTVSRWESGNISNMRRDRIAAYAKALHLAPAAIMGTTPSETEEKEDKDRILIDMIRKLSDSQKELLVQLMENMIKGNK